MSFSISDTVGAYHILEELGRGGILQILIRRSCHSVGIGDHPFLKTRHNHAPVSMVKQSNRLVNRSATLLPAVRVATLFRQTDLLAQRLQPRIAPEKGKFRKSEVYAYPLGT
jgi:hypothetical protein